MEFYSPGKLLITGEYVVLDGAVAFALPTAFGQSMHVEPIAEPVLDWISYDVEGQVWMQERVTLIELLQEEGKEKGSPYLQTLIRVLRAAHQQNPVVLQQGCGFRVQCFLTFPRLWGLGTSSTWINNVAQWFEINPYQLLQDSFGGSGYDIACAQHNRALFYQLTSPVQPQVDPLDFHPAFEEQLYFVYLNQKQSSKEAIAAYRKKKEFAGESIQRVTAISKAVATTTSVDVFKALLQEHETVLGAILEIQPIQERLFTDFEGVIKSLGAWGGDFVLAVSSKDPTDYFEKKGYTTVIPYRKMIAI